MPAGIEIVGYTADKSQDARLVTDDAFRDHWRTTQNTDESWAHFMGYQAFRPSYSFLAYDGGEPLGVVLAHEYDSYTRATGRLELYIPTVGTRRIGRKRGIATALLSQTLHAARSAGFVSVDARCRLGLADGSSWPLSSGPDSPCRTHGSPRQSS